MIHPAFYGSLQDDKPKWFAPSRIWTGNAFPVHPLTLPIAIDYDPTKREKADEGSKKNAGVSILSIFLLLERLLFNRCGGHSTEKEQLHKNRLC